MDLRKVMSAGLCLGALLITPKTIQAQHDPGPRGGQAAAGGAYNTLNSDEKTFFGDGLSRFMEIDSVSGKVAGEDGSGLGPSFNGNSCAMCHAQPAVGGSSPGPASPQIAVPNPQVALATLDGARNFVPSFITQAGPVREARFVRNPDGSPDGGVHGLFTIAGRSDAPGCSLAQPLFEQQVAARNVIFRIPTPTFGLGLVENTPDAALQANLAADQRVKSFLGIGGSLNTSGNDGTVTRFGWKAQNKSLMIFAGEAYNVEQGVSNEAFPNERNAVKGCVFNGTSEDATHFNSTASILDASSDLVGFATFMRLSAPPMPALSTPSTQNGSDLFRRVGCVLCHSESLTTGASPYTGMSAVVYHPYSDFALHHMGSGLADGISQGAAGPDEFRTAPLWGVGQRLFFLHDGRTSDLVQAIQFHASRGGDDCRWQHDRYHQRNCGSEANAVIRNFQALSPSQVQDLLNFLRSL